MKYISLFIAICLITVLTFCKGEKEAVTEIIRNPAIAKCLSEGAVFNKDSAQHFKEWATDIQKAEARKYFLRALDLLVNKNRANESIKLFKEAIMYFPDDKTYFFLAEAYINISAPDNALQANSLSMLLGYDSYHDIIFNEALIYAINKDTSNCISTLDEAIYSGFLNKDKIVKEKKFDFIREDSRYISLIVNTFNDDDKLRALLFKRFMNSMPDIDLPYALLIDSVANRDYEHYINYDYAVFVPGMEDGRFSRDVTNEYLYAGKLKLENNHFALIYKSVLAIADTLNPVKTFVITYDSVGTVIDNEMIGCFCSPTTSQSFIISQENSIEVTEYTYKWKLDPLEKGYAGNQIESFEMANPAKIKLQQDGVIKREGFAKKEIKDSKTDG